MSMRFKCINIAVLLSGTRSFIPRHILFLFRVFVNDLHSARRQLECDVSRPAFMRSAGLADTVSASARPVTH